MITKPERPTEAAYAAAAWLLLVEPNALKAIAMVESGDAGAFLDSGEPVILYERHLFSALTRGRFDREHADISNPQPGGYGPLKEQHPKLQRAAALDRDAALKSCSWGLFQILGQNHVRAGYPSLQRFITAMYRSAEDHLRALVMFIRHDERLVDAARGKDWAAFAYVYNGPAYARNKYDVRIAQAYALLSGAA